MIRELWSTFPHLLVKKINGLLETAEPSSAKAFQLYKNCQGENLWQDTFELFSRRLNDFFSLPPVERRKSDFDRYLNAPMSHVLYENFHLTFKTASVDQVSLLNIASWAHHLMRVSRKTESVVISTDVLTKTLRYLTNPPLFEKDENIEFEDFCSAWKKTVFKLFGKKYDSDLNGILQELHRINSELAHEELQEEQGLFVPSIYLTQTEIDWTLAVQKAAIENSPIPKFPLKRGAEKPRLKDLERTISLYRIVQTTRLPELIEQRNNIRTTILDLCERLLRERAK